MSGQLFTNEEISIIRDNYLKISIQELKKMLPGRSVGGIRAKANSLGIKKIYSTRKCTKEEKDWLIKNYRTCSDKDLISYFPDFTIKQIHKKASGLGLKRGTRKNFSEEEVQIIIKNYPNITARQLAKLLPGHSPDTITNKANSLGITKGRKPPRKWLSVEVDWLNKFYVDASESELIERFPDDDIETIVNKANSLGLSRDVDNTLEFNIINGELVVTKKCSSCRQRKLSTEFFKSKNKRSGLSSICKVCKGKQEKVRRSLFTDEKKALNRLKGKIYKAEQRRKNPERQKEISRRSYQLHKEERRESQRRKYKENPEYFKNRNKIWREKNPDKIKANNLNRKAMKKALPNNLTREDLISLLSNGEKECALTGKVVKCDYCHFIPLRWGHGGSYKANIFLALSALNIGMSANNPFNWFQLRTDRLSKDNVNRLINRLAAENNLSIEDYREFIYWCEQNQRSLEEVRLDTRPSIKIWAEQRQQPTYSVILPPWD